MKSRPSDTLPPSEVTDEEEEEDEENRGLNMMCWEYPGLTKVFFVTNMGYGQKFEENGDLEIADLMFQPLEKCEIFAEAFIRTYKKLDGRELSVEFVDLALKES